MLCRYSRYISDSWIPPLSPPSMAADSMEIDDSLYRQVKPSWLYTSQSVLVVCTKALVAEDKVTQYTERKWLCFILQINAVIAPHFSLLIWSLTLPLHSFPSVQPPAICAGRQRYAPDGSVLSLSQWNGRSGNWDRWAKYLIMAQQHCNVVSVCIDMVCIANTNQLDFLFHSKEYCPGWCEGVYSH